jgi:Tfp pilus assembly major pilin PilA
VTNTSAFDQYKTEAKTIMQKIGSDKDYQVNTQKVKVNAIKSKETHEKETKKKIKVDINLNNLSGTHDEMEFMSFHT